MQSWHTTYLGLRELPREISTFELQSFFTYSRTERELINARFPVERYASEILPSQTTPKTGTGG